MPPPSIPPPRPLSLRLVSCPLARWLPSVTWMRTRSGEASTVTKTLRCEGPLQGGEGGDLGPQNDQCPCAACPLTGGHLRAGRGEGIRAAAGPHGQHGPEPTRPLAPQERPKPRIPILHFRAARPPFVICVKLVSVSRGRAPLTTAWLGHAPSCGIATSDMGQRCWERPPQCPCNMGCLSIKAMVFGNLLSARPEAPSGHLSDALAKMKGGRW